MERGLFAVLGLVVGVVVALGVFALFILDAADSGDPPETSFPAIDHDEVSADGLVAAWTRWRTATFVSEGIWTRTIDGVDEPLTGPVYTAQRPPRRLVVRLGSTVEEIDRTVATCDASDDDVIVPGCTAGDSGISFDDRVAAELLLVGGYVDGDRRLYDVDRGEPGCYRVELIAPILAAPWGRWAEFCFDPASGALASARVLRPSAIDLEVINIIRTEVTDADFG